MVMEVVHEDMGDENMQCPNHPYRNSTPGGICAYCLQEKLGKLVSSSFPVSNFPSSSASSSSPSFRSDFNGSSTSSAPASASAATTALQLHHLPPSSSSTTRNVGSDSSYYSRKTKIPFVKKYKKKDPAGVVELGINNSDSSTSIVFKRSKSTVTPRRGMNFMDEEEYSPHRKGFWSFLSLPKNYTPRKVEKHHKDLNFTPTTPSSSVCNAVIAEGNDNSTPDFERRVSRSRSVGCGSRSFSGDFFERISTGFGDCTLRRVESQREGKPPKAQSVNGQDCIKERVRCGGIFSGFMVASSSSSSSSSSYWDSNGKPIGPSIGHVSTHGRSKSWGWALASPMRAFGKPSSAKRPNSNKNVTPNLSAIPSLLAVGG